MSCGVGHRRSSDSALLWLWCRPAAIAWMWPLAWELSCATPVALKRKKKKITWVNTCNTVRTILDRGSIILAIIIIISCYQFFNFYLYIFLICIYPTIYAEFNHFLVVIRFKVMVYFSPPLDCFFFFPNLAENSMRRLWANQPRAIISQWWPEMIFMKRYSGS